MPDGNSYLGYVVSVSSSKGGVGKTTTTNIAANILAEEGYTVTILDADPNYPQVSWYKQTVKSGTINKNLHVIKVDSDTSVISMIKQAKDESDIVFVDLEGRGSLTASDAMSRSDLVIIPVQPSVLDSKEAAKGLRLIQEAEERFEKKIPHVIVFTKTDVCLTPDNYWELREQFEAKDTPILKVEMHDREQFREVFLFGGSLASLKAEAVNSLEEDIRLHDKINTLINKRVSIPKDQQVDEHSKILKTLYHNKKVIKGRIEKNKRKIVSLDKALTNVKSFVTSLVKYLQGDIETTTYKKGLRPKPIQELEMGLDILEMMELEA